MNSTFYGQPRANAALGWVKRTPQDFEFAVKMYQKFTHPNMAVDPGPVTQADVDAFKGGIDPLAAAGKLGPLLVQFPFSFQRTDEAVDYLRWLLRAFVGIPAGVELRHRSWSDAAAETDALLDEHRASWVQIDEPKFESSIRQDLSAGDVRHLLPPPARPQREGVVGPRRVGRSLQLFLLGRGARADRRQGAPAPAS